MRIIHCTRPDDTDLIIQLAKDCCAEHGEEAIGGPFNLEHYVAEWKRILSSDCGVMFGAVDDSGKVYGGIGGCIGKAMLTGRPRAQQIFWYVTPEHRNGLTAIRLLDRFEKWAKERGCENVHMPVHERMSDNTTKVYARRGYRPLETLYRKAL